MLQESAWFSNPPERGEELAAVGGDVEVDTPGMDPVMSGYWNVSGQQETVGRVDAARSSCGLPPPIVEEVAADVHGVAVGRDRDAVDRVARGRVEGGVDRARRGVHRADPRTRPTPPSVLNAPPT